MILGECPYCEEPFTAECPADTPAMGRLTCEKCGKWFWEYYSRFEPRSYLPDEIEVDEAARRVKVKKK